MFNFYVRKNLYVKLFMSNFLYNKFWEANLTDPVWSRLCSITAKLVIECVLPLRNSQNIAVRNLTTGWWRRRRRTSDRTENPQHCDRLAGWLRPQTPPDLGIWSMRPFLGHIDHMIDIFAPAATARHRRARSAQWIFLWLRQWSGRVGDEEFHCQSKCASAGPGKQM